MDFKGDKCCTLLALVRTDEDFRLSSVLESAILHAPISFSEIVGGSTIMYYIIV